METAHCPALGKQNNLCSSAEVSVLIHQVLKDRNANLSENMQSLCGFFSLGAPQPQLPEDREVSGFWQRG